MRVRISQLSEICDTHIILNDIEELPNGDHLGTIKYLDSELTDEASQYIQPGMTVCALYQESEYYNGEVIYND